MTDQIEPLDRTLRGRCGACDHVWIVAHLPMPVDDVAKLAKRAACPCCAGTEVFVATGQDLTSQEASQ